MIFSVLTTKLSDVLPSGNIVMSAMPFYISTVIVNPFVLALS